LLLIDLHQLIKSGIIKQAKALGESFADINISAIHASPLKRAHSTAKAIHDSHAPTKAGNPIEFNVDPDLREQHFGIAEGHPWARPGTEAAKTDIQHKAYPAKTGRDDKFPEGESLNELNQRASRAIDRIIIPAVLKAKGEKIEGVEGTHIIIVSHGLCISELLGNLVARTGKSVRSGEYAGLNNTAWTRVQVGLKDEGDGEVGGESIEGQDPSTTPLFVKVVAINSKKHLHNVKRQSGGIGSMSHDADQKDIRAFFGGASIAPQPATPPAGNWGIR